MKISIKDKMPEKVRDTRVCPHCSEFFENVTTPDFARHLRGCPQSDVPQERINYMRWGNMKNAIFEVMPDFNIKRLKPLLWHDGINDVFIVTKQMEIYFFSRYILECYCWSFKTFVLLRRKGLIFDDRSTDDKLYLFKTGIENLPALIDLGGYKRRPDRKGRRIRSRSEKLGHEIITFKPIF